MAEIKGTAMDLHKVRQLEKEREKKRLELEQRKLAVQEAGSVGKLTSIEEKFQANKSAYAENLELSSVGLVSAEEYKKRKLVAERKDEIESKRQAQENREIKRVCAANRKKALTNLSFDVEDEDEDADQGIVSIVPKVSSKSKSSSFESKKIDSEATAETTEKSEISPKSPSNHNKTDVNKDPTVATDFLPDHRRQQIEKELREQLEREWAAKQEEIKKEKIEIVYSYWDGSGHRRSITVDKGTRIDQFLDACRRDLIGTFSELRGVSVENMMYIKEDLIIPHHYTFYDLIVTKARGKSGPLFHFDVHDDVRLTSDARIEKDESHAGKVLTQGWYVRNKHVFPASRWEIYDPTKEYREYTTGGNIVQKDR